MGIGMQIVYLGFAGSRELEGEAGAQLVRLERYSNLLSGCHLAIEALRPRSSHPVYDVRLDLLLQTSGFKPLEHCSDEVPRLALQRAFDLAERELATLAGRATARAH
ncbi:hypothetical protein QYH69_06265 [Paraburkholderia sp. SARCC-3016]|jgi:hypothetical protein|uniref:hypothetical protein n=1 Tax=Paraburkholderia sp. SARCC-3016 TaxID=3058611 RepID=UPI00280687FF|nr:hypothetical protein [Paraburkholderia sp. SARCC-3016]MDQ7976846.1 hypothetical protein [Paraburkholderia sp. SARCC-3016]